jgi:hypothetical protein
MRGQAQQEPEYGDEYAEQPAAMPPAEGQAFSSWIEEQVRNTPWWLISIAFHLILLAGMTVITFKEEFKLKEEPTIIPLQSQAPKKLDLDRPRDVFERKGIPKPGQENAKPTDEPAIFFPDAEESDHNESADNEDYGKMKGDSEEFLSAMPGEGGGIRGRQPGKAPGVYDAMGVGGGGGGGGRYGGRLGGRKNLVARGGGTQGPGGTESAVTAGLRWLARHQSPDGKWSAQQFHGQCAGTKCTGEGYGEYDAGLTGLSLLAFLGAGYTHLTKESYVDPHTNKTVHWGEVIKKGLKWMMENQDAEGCFGGRNGSKYMYNHAIAALCMAEAYGLTNSTLFKEPAQKGIDFLIAAQNPYKAWRYSKLCGDNDTSVTGWAVMALKSADISGLATSRTGYDGAMAWVVEVTDEAYYKVGYTAKGTGKVVVQGKNEDWDGHEALTAVGMLIRIFINHKKDDPALEGGAKLLVADLPKYSGKAIDYYYWYYASLALFQFDGPDGKYWKGWNEAMKQAIVPTQKTKKDGCQDGSWDSEVDRWGFEGGRVYATAINVLTLEVYYRYENAFGGGKRK